MKQFFYPFKILLHDGDSSIKLTLDLSNYQLRVTEGSGVLNSKLTSESQSREKGLIFFLIIKGLKMK